MTSTIDEGAARLRATLPVFTRGNLFHATARVSPKLASRAAFDAALRRRLERGPIKGLLRSTRPGGADRVRLRMSKEEQLAYYPAAILLVDRRSVVDLFAASGALIQARVAVVDVAGYPRAIVRWLVTGARAGHSAPIGYLHDATTTLYPFFFEPLATLAAKRAELRYRDLGFPLPAGFRDPYTKARAHDLEAATPAALVSYAVRRMLEMLEPDTMLLPRASAPFGA